MKIDYQFLTLADVGVLDHVAKDVFDDAIDPIGTQEFLSDPRQTLIVAKDMNKGGLIIGFVSALTYFHPDKPVPEMFINEVSVAPDYRRQHIGKTMMEYIFTKAQTLGCKCAWLATDRNNDAALALYRAAGGHPPEDHIHIEFDLSSE